MIPRVLIVDDNRADIDLILLAFEEAGLNAFIATAQDGHDAQAKMNHCRPNLMLLDINMPKADGFEVLRMIRDHQQFAGTPVIMMSSSNSSIDQARAHLLGVIRYWVKPIRFSEWVALVRTLPATTVAFGGAPAPSGHDGAQATSIRPRS